MADISEDVITPVQAFAQSAHEMFTELKNAGFEPTEAMEILLSQLPEWIFPVPYDYDDEDEEIPDEGDY